MYTSSVQQNEKKLAVIVAIAIELYIQKVEQVFFIFLLILLNTIQFWWLLSLALNNSIINIYTFGVLIFTFPDTIRITYGHCVCTNQYKFFLDSNLVLYAGNHTKRRVIWDQFLLMIIAMFNLLFLVLQSVRWTHWIWITDGTEQPEPDSLWSNSAFYVVWDVELSPPNRKCL